MEWYLKVLKNYAVFEGRARRKEYWMFVLVNLIVEIILSVIGSLLHIRQFLTGLYSLAVFLPSLAVSVRRLHDSGRSGLWVLIGLIPFIGAIVLLVFFCLDSEEGNNRFGPNPKDGLGNNLNLS
ncbi:DUF805 domain-containing protein [Neobacillus fumarioli]|uniref:DUF805 domain-containing protein n=1 Tax=Neobacillus fumarioli TaxID=105229 RepID=UPI00083096AA|nr:DUF805 domain-containing protein [Neobacillus fumarioli]